MIESQIWIFLQLTPKSSNSQKGFAIKTLNNACFNLQNMNYFLGISYTELTTKGLQIRTKNRIS